jgi:excisionase family DNA binding protein
MRTDSDTKDRSRTPTQRPAEDPSILPPPHRTPKPPALSSLLLTVAEVAELLRTTPKAIYCMIGRGQLPVTRVGRRVLVRRDMLERALDERTAASPSRR